jgi:hypothetical protein
MSAAITADDVVRLSAREASPPVSPTVVAQILMIQNASVTAGTLLKASWTGDSFGRASSIVADMFQSLSA